jgi:hypothetical protein
MHLWDGGRRLRKPVEDKTMSNYAINFEAFRATGKATDDLVKAMPEAFDDSYFEDEDGNPLPRGGRTYFNNELFILKESDTKWSLMLYRDEYESEDLEELERRLYEFALEEGMLDYSALSDGSLLHEIHDELVKLHKGKFDDDVAKTLVHNAGNMIADPRRAFSCVDDLEEELSMDVAELRAMVIEYHHRKEVRHG